MTSGKGSCHLYSDTVSFCPRTSFSREGTPPYRAPLPKSLPVPLMGYKNNSIPCTGHNKVRFVLTTCTAVRSFLTSHAGSPVSMRCSKYTRVICCARIFPCQYALLADHFAGVKMMYKLTSRTWPLPSSPCLDSTSLCSLYYRYVT